MPGGRVVPSTPPEMVLGNEWSPFLSPQMGFFRRKMLRNGKEDARCGCSSVAVGWCQEQGLHPAWASTCLHSAEGQGCCCPMQGGWGKTLQCGRRRGDTRERVSWGTSVPIRLQGTVGHLGAKGEGGHRGCCRVVGDVHRAWGAKGCCAEASGGEPDTGALLGQNKGAGILGAEEVKEWAFVVIVSCQLKTRRCHAPAPWLQGSRGTAGRGCRPFSLMLLGITAPS